MDPSIPPYARTQSHLFARSHLRLGRWALGLRKPLAHFRLITEFGSGSAEMAHVARGLGFRGLFLIYDLPPMLLLQRYWLRLAGLPAYLLHHDVAPAMLRMPPGGSPAAAATPCVLVSSLHTDASTGEMLLPIALRAIAKSVNVESVSSAQHRHQAHSVDLLLGRHSDADDLEDGGVEVDPADGELAGAPGMGDDTWCLDVVPAPHSAILYVMFVCIRINLYVDLMCIKYTRVA